MRRSRVDPVCECDVGFFVQDLEEQEWIVNFGFYGKCFIGMNVIEVVMKGAGNVRAMQPFDKVVIYISDPAKELVFESVYGFCFEVFHKMQASAGKGGDPLEA